MLYYLDTMIVIYAVEGNVADQQRALNHLATLEQAGHRFVTSYPTSRILPLRNCRERPRLLATG